MQVAAARKERAGEWATAGLLIAAEELKPALEEYQDGLFYSLRLCFLAYLTWPQSSRCSLAGGKYSTEALKE